MPRIQRLTDDVIGKIAAGEVVERPAAAIKELVENSLDAGASAITVEIRDGGISYLRVTDNGCGIPQGDIRMAFERHATSKITSARELSAVATLGFRGEALASIAAVGKVTCTTRTAQDATGVKLVNEGGRVLSIEEAACPEGTSMVVRDLFFNTPVRLKFLKKPAVEAGLVSDIVMRQILCRPDVSFRLISQGKTVYHSAGDGRLESAVFSIYGAELARSMRKVKGSQGGVALHGYVGIGESGRGNRSNQSFFVNGRYMHSALLSAALEEACRERVMIGKYPTCVLHLTMPYEAVDVNVHPNKLEVRFADESAVAGAVETLVREAIADRDALQRPVAMQLTESAPAPATVVKSREAEPLPKPAAAAAPMETVPAEPLKPRAPIPVAATLAEARQTQPQQPAPRPALKEAASAWTAGTAQGMPPTVTRAEAISFLPQEQQKPLKLLGVLFNTYILVEYEDHLLMIDQHAVHERLLYERMMKAYDTHHAGQELLMPLVASVTRREQQVLMENQALLEGLGFSVAPFGDSEVSIRSVPMVLGEPQTISFLHEVLDQLMGEAQHYSEDKRRSAILQTACKHAVKGGEALSEPAIRELVSRMIDEKVTPTCPHGRPLVVALSHTELDRKFRRIQ